MPSDLETRLTALAASFDELRARFERLESGCSVKHVAYDRRAEAFEEELTEHDRTIDLLKAEFTEQRETLKVQGETLKQLSRWVERWGMETTSLGRTLEHLDERQGVTSQTTQTILEKLGDVMNVVNELAADVKKGRGDGR